MHVVLVNGSPRINGGTASSLRIIENQLTADDITTENIQIGDQVIRGCMSCYYCKREKKCKYDNDIVNTCIEKIKKADGIVIGSPVYYGSIAGTLKCFLDRIFFAGSGYEFKVGAAVVNSRREGGISTVQDINNYFNLAQILIVPSRYWTSIYGNNESEVNQDKEGTQILENLGKNMAWLIKTVKNASPRVFTDNEKVRVATNFIR